MEMIKEFDNYIRYERQLSQHTIERYQYTLKEFNTFLNSDIVYKKRTDEVERDDISRFIVYLTNKKLSRASIANYISTLRMYYKWLAYMTKKDNLIATNFFLTNIIKIKKESQTPYIPSVEEVKSLRRALATYIDLLSYDKSLVAYRKAIQAYTIIELLITSGMRSEELRNLRYKDMDLENKTAFICVGKGGHQRISLFGISAVEALKEYFALNNHLPDDLLFPFKQSNVLNYIIKRWCKRAKINDRIHCHSFRHYFITESQRQGIPAEIVATQVGHQSLQSTLHYTHFNIENLREKFNNVNI